MRVSTERWAEGTRAMLGRLCTLRSRRTLGPTRGGGLGSSLMVDDGSLWGGDRMNEAAGLGGFVGVRVRIVRLGGSCCDERDKFSKS